MREVISRLPIGIRSGTVWVTTAFEDYTQATLELAEYVECPTRAVLRHPDDRQWSIRDKAEMRRRWAEHACKTGKHDYVVASHLCLTEQDALRKGDEFFKQGVEAVVVKPRGMAASLAVVRVTNPMELSAAVRNAFGADFVENLKQYGMAPGGILVEEYIDGREFSLEVIVDKGLAEIAAITEKHTGATENCEFAELAHVVPARGLEPRHRTSFRHVTDFVIAALGIFNCVIHLEVKLTQKGRVVPIEVGIRPAGDRIPLLLFKHSGIDLIDSHVCLAFDQPLRSASAIAPEADNRFSALIFAKSAEIWRRLSVAGDSYFSGEGDCAGQWGSILVRHRSSEQLDDLLRVAEVI